MKRFWAPETGIFLGLWLFLMLDGRTHLFHDPGTFWHTRIGLDVLEKHQLLRHDPFSFTSARLHPEQAWIPHQWLSECVMAFVYRLGGWDSLLLTTATLLAGLFTWIAHRLIQTGIHWLLVAVLTALAFAASSSHLHVRPHLVTIVFFGLTCAWLNDFEAERIPLRRLFWLVPLDLLWSNLHGGVLGAWFTTAIAFAGWTLARFFNQPSPLKRWTDVFWLGFLLLACVLSSLLNPYSWRLPQAWLEIMSSSRLSEIIVEHAPLNPSEPQGLTVLLLGVIYLVVLAGVFPNWPRVTWLLPIIWLYLACTRIRHAPLFAMAASVTFADVFPHTRWAAALVRRGSDLFTPQSKDSPRRIPRLAWVIPTVVVSSSLVLQTGRIEAPILGRGWVSFNPRLWPVALTQSLRAFPPGTHIYNDLNFGGFIIFFAPNLQVFVDDRCELYGEEFLAAYDHAVRHDPARIEMWSNEFGFKAALTETGSALDRYLRDPAHGWQLIQESEAATLFQKNSAAR